MNQSPQKKHLGQGIQRQYESYEGQNRLSTLGMRIRQSVDRGYQVGDSPSAAASTSPAKFGSTGGASQDACSVQDNSDFTIPAYKRVPLPAAKQPPMLVNARTVSSSSSLEMWEHQLDERLELIDNDIMRNKRAFDQVEDW
ncbi:LADA_0H14356g1_1 [Lachancea dasiensis]|uniref:Damage-regulated import facilitator 1 n=1 Tax=Lachancea dasiensis TaxID=1072105 RepID=A0A1G4K4D7_9SACH|nr:LADA_0H14356g1_1 [Lachancea dasiensis]